MCVGVIFSEKSPSDIWFVSRGVRTFAPAIRDRRVFRPGVGLRRYLVELQRDSKREARVPAAADDLRPPDAWGVLPVGGCPVKRKKITIYNEEFDPGSG